MPELPEVETVRRLLAPAMVGARITQAWARLPRRTVPSIAEFVAVASGRRILDACRHGKQLYFPLEGDVYLTIHLGMTGIVHVEPSPRPIRAAAAARRTHVHAILRLDNALQVVFHDPRTFGEVGVAADRAFIEHFGPDPLDAAFREADVVRRLQGRSVKLKAALLDQRIVAGLGNIYADEVCFQARVHPERRAHTLSARKLREVVECIRPVLARAVEAHGATIKTQRYEDIFGDRGVYVPDAYGRTGLPCSRCGTLIRRGVLGPGRGARSYHYCPKCQRP